MALARMTRMSEMKTCNRKMSNSTDYQSILPNLLRGSKSSVHVSVLEFMTISVICLT